MKYKQNLQHSKNLYANSRYEAEIFEKFFQYLIQKVCLSPFYVHEWFTLGTSWRGLCNTHNLIKLTKLATLTFNCLRGVHSKDKYIHKLSYPPLSYLIYIICEVIWMFAKKKECSVYIFYCYRHMYANKKSKHICTLSEVT